MDSREVTRSLIPWRFFRELEEPRDYFDSLFYRSLVPYLGRQPFGENAWGPALEITEQDDKYVVKAELPGMKQEDIEITVSDQTLNIKGEKKHKEEIKEGGYRYSEVSYGSFHRTVSLPADVADGKIEATYEDGVLAINVPKKQESKPKKVTIESKKK